MTLIRIVDHTPVMKPGQKIATTLFEILEGYRTGGRGYLGF